MTRDMSRKQFVAAMNRHGWTKDDGYSFFGYWTYRDQTEGSNNSLNVSEWNVEHLSFRKRLAYFIKTADRYQQECEA